MKRYDFKDGIDFSDFFYCYSPQAKCCGEFEREADCIKNRYNPEVRDYEYTTVMLKEKLSLGHKITVECDFEKRGAPLVIISDSLYEKGGHTYYGEHFEAVAFEEGCNVWHNSLPTDPDYPKALVTDKIHFEDIPTPNKSRVTLSVAFGEGRLDIEMNGVAFTVYNAELPREFYFGITGCEGINRFYSLTVE
jgi:hypothetical protein